MEKLVYLLMGRPGTVGADVGAALRKRCAPAMKAVGAHSVQVNVVDDSLGPPFGVAPDAEADQILAAVQVWVDAAEGSKVGQTLPQPADSGSRWHGWVVCEAEPLPNRTRPPRPDGSVDGFAQLVALLKPDRLSWSAWRRAWQATHTPVAVNTQSSFRYVQNVVFRAITRGAPPYVAVVEECFPDEAATDLQVFFDAVGDDARLARHMAAMSESCDRFMDGMAPVAWTREWIL